MLLVRKSDGIFLFGSFDPTRRSRLDHSLSFDPNPGEAIGTVFERARGIGKGGRKGRELLNGAINVTIDIAALR